MRVVLPLVLSSSGLITSARLWDKKTVTGSFGAETMGMLFARAHGH
jgi:hypothetical protein